MHLLHVDKAILAIAITGYRHEKTDLICSYGSSQEYCGACVKMSFLTFTSKIAFY